MVLILLYLIFPSLCIPFSLPLWQSSPIIPIHKMGKLHNSSAFFCSISLTSCVSKVLERIIVCCLLFFLEFNFILSPHRTSFRPGQFTLDQILNYFPSILNGFNKPKPGSRTILATIDFPKAFDSVRHLLFSIGLFRKIFPFALFDEMNLFFSDRRAWVFYRSHESCSFRSVLQGFVLALFISLFINDLPRFLLTRVSCFLYADALAKWYSSL